jgi:hypothetical protein
VGVEGFRKAVIEHPKFDGLSYLAIDGGPRVIASTVRCCVQLTIGITNTRIWFNGQAGTALSETDIETECHGAKLKTVPG